MKITIFGASRGVGRATVDAAVAAGHTVTAFSRSAPEGLPAGATSLTGDVLDAVAVRAALAGSAAVVVSLGVSPSRRSNTPEDICSRGTATILAAMTATSLDRIVVVTSYGVGETRSRTPFPFSLIAKTVLRGIMADKERQEADVRASATRWTIVQPLGLTDGAATGHPYAATDGSRASTRVSRADVGAFCVSAIDGNAFIGAAVSLSAA